MDSFVCPDQTLVTSFDGANIAVRLAFLDHLSHGRMNCGFGEGGVTTGHELFGLANGKTQGVMTFR